MVLRAPFLHIWRPGQHHRKVLGGLWSWGRWVCRGWLPRPLSPAWCDSTCCGINLLTCPREVVGGVPSAEPCLLSSNQSQDTCSCLVTGRQESTEHNSLPPVPTGRCAKVGPHPSLRHWFLFNEKEGLSEQSKTSKPSCLPLIASFLALP